MFISTRVYYTLRRKKLYFGVTLLLHLRRNIIKFFNELEELEKTNAKLWDLMREKLLFRIGMGPNYEIKQFGGRPSEFRWRGERGFQNGEEESEESEEEEEKPLEDENEIKYDEDEDEDEEEDTVGDRNDNGKYESGVLPSEEPDEISSDETSDENEADYEGDQE